MRVAASAPLRLGRRTVGTEVSRELLTATGAVPRVRAVEVNSAGDTRSVGGLSHPPVQRLCSVVVLACVLVAAYDGV